MIDFEIRPIEELDYQFIISVLNDWWDGRNMADMLPRLFFRYFSNTSFVATKENEIIGFIVGFLAQNDESNAYIHFIGVSPAYRRQGIGDSLYKAFFGAIKKYGRNSVSCVTSPVNKGSIVFHKALGFRPIPGDTEIDGIPVHSNYDGYGEHRVLFRKLIKE